MKPVVIKLGGSLALHPQKLKTLCLKLSELSRQHRLVVVPGGGEFADTVRHVDKRFTLPPQTSHKMAILGMDQYGFLLSDLMPNSSIVHNFELQKIFDSGKLALFLPSNYFFVEDPLENSWSVTSDSIAAFIAGKLCSPKLVLVTDVDGIYTRDPKKHPDAKLIRRLFAGDLLKMDEQTNVDSFLPKLLLQMKFDCFVVNGLFPERIEAVLNDQETVCTFIGKD